MKKYALLNRKFRFFPNLLQVISLQIIFLCSMLLLFPAASPADPSAYSIKTHPGHYLVVPRGHVDAMVVNKLKRTPEFRGVSVMYEWINLEKDKGVYDFSSIKRDLARLASLHKRLIVMIRDKSFSQFPFIPVPAYMRTQEYAGGYYGRESTGYIAKRWNPAVAKRFRALLLALGRELRASPNYEYFEAVKTSESAINTYLSGSDYTPEAYAEQLKLTAETLAQAFPDRPKFLYLNWLPYGSDYLESVARHALAHGVGIGGPDVHPDVAMPSYPLYSMVARAVPVMVDVQWSDYMHTTPPGDTEALFEFATKKLSVSYICWQYRSGFVSEILQTIKGHPSW